MSMATAMPHIKRAGDAMRRSNSSRTVSSLSSFN